MTSNSQPSPSNPAVALHPPVWGSSAITRAALPGDRDADVAIIGGGYTGLWTAYYLITADPTLRVTILESEYVGFGASGRNGGWCSAIFPISLDRVTHYSDRQSAINLQQAMNDTVDEIGTVVRREAIDCDFAHEGFVSLARTPAQLSRVDGARVAAARYGFDDQWSTLGADEARKIVNATGVLGGTFTEHCALIHPGKLVRGLAALVEDLGVTIYEGTRVHAITAGQVETNRGR
ncbi:MAG TPA: FAD-dependent oxidoreductase, partial [Mycobacterium sp.]